MTRNKLKPPTERELAMAQAMCELIREIHKLNNCLSETTYELWQYDHINDCEPCVNEARELIAEVFHD